MTAARGIVAAGCLLAVAAGADPGAQPPPTTARTARSDVAGVSTSEVILENEYVRVNIQGISPARPVTPSFWGRFWRQPAGPPTYGTRFVGPGWIGNLVFKPTGRRWFASALQNGEAWRGVPEEFEQAVRIRETRPGVWQCLKLGVGLCEGRGWCLRDSLKLVDPGHWEMSIDAVTGGGQSVTFVQTVRADGGYAYRYTKRLVLMPGDARLLIERSLANTGSHELASTWYAHAFWGQGKDGAFDEQCWATIPLRRGPAGTPRPELEVDACTIGAFAGTGYWGPLDGALVGDAWYACGNHVKADVLLTILPEIPAFYRVWTCAPTYSLEPFRLVRLEAGQEQRWSETLACAAGLDRLETHDGLAAYGASVVPGSEGSPARVTLQVLPFREVRHGTLQVHVHPESGVERSFEVPIPSAGPAQPVVVPMGDLADVLPARVEVRLRADPAAPAAAVEERVGWLDLRPLGALAAEIPQHANGARALVLGAFGRDAQGAPTPSHAAAYLLEYLRTAGFVPELRLDQDGMAETGQPPALVVFAGLRVLPTQVVRRLETFVRGGGGLVVCGPIDPLGLEFTDLLPLQSAGASVRLETGPRDGTREFLAAWRQRYQLAPASSHPVVQGLSLYPEAHQDIGVLQVLTAAPTADVLLRYCTPPGLLPDVASPALVVSAYGSGRVAVLASPVDWGVPVHWLLWSRVGEQHRELFSRLSRWAAAGALPPPASGAHASECGARGQEE